MRIKDKVYEEDWELTHVTAPGSTFLIGAHHILGTLALSLVIIQSALSLNIYIFAIWLVLAIIILLTDLFRGRKINLSSEVAFGAFFAIGTAVSLLLSNTNSMFFPATLGRMDIILYQASAGICVSLRFLTTFFYVEYYEQEHRFIKTKSRYSQEQVQQYKDNLILTDFEYREIKKVTTLQKWSILLRHLRWPFVILLIFTGLAALYALMIYFIIPNNSIAEYIIRPSLIVVAIIFSVILIRINTVLPKIVEAEEDEESQEEHFEMEIDDDLEDTVLEKSQEQEIN